VSAGGAEAGAPYFRDYVQSVATAELGIDEHLLLEGGVRIYTTLDAKTQAAAEAAVRAAVSGTSEQQAALVAIEPATGYIRAMVGGLDYAEHQYNRAVNALRQPGSAFKPVLYAAALQDRMATPVTRIMSEPTVFTYDEGRQTYTPHNYNYNYAEKEIDMREAIASSDNIYAVSTLMNVGAERVIAYAGEMGIAPERLAAVPSLALGSSPVSPLEMASAFSTFAAGGVRTAPTAVVRIEDRSGRVLYEAEPTRTRVVGAAEAYVMTSMLEGVFGDSGTARRVAATIKRPVAGKTGTTATDAWLVGYTPQLATAVWVGYDKDRKLSKAESHMAAPIFAQFTEQALSDVPPADFPMPLGVARVFIDPLSGKLAGPDCTEQRAEYFVRGTEPREFCDAHYGSLQERLHAEEATLSDDATRDKKRSFWQGFRRLWGG
jgi:membrane peptidoglycan carboxypeptidase